MLDLKACTVCFSTEVKLFNMDKEGLRLDYNTVVGLKSCTGDGLPNYLCLECSAYVRKFKKFRTKCHRATFTLLEILKRTEEIAMDDLQAIDRDTLDLMPSLSNWTLNRVHYESVKFQWVKHNRLSMVKGDIPVLSIDNLTPNKIAEPPKKVSTASNTEETWEVELEDTKDHDFMNFNQETNDAYDELNVVIPIEKHDDFDDNYFEGEAEGEAYDETEEKHEVQVQDDDVQPADGSNLDEEYASFVPLSTREQSAAVEIYKMFSHGKYRCEVCSKGYHTDKRLKIHLRMHDKHISGHFLCELCNYYYKTEFLLRTHVTEKHLYKYICRKCPEVNFDRIAAKQHYIWTHLQHGNKKHSNWYESRPTWLSSRGGKRRKGVVSIRPVRKITKLPDDFLIYSPVTQLEQYAIVNERRKSKNYLESEFKCESCYRGFREATTYNKHIRKHDSDVSGKFMCDMCKLCFRDARKIYKHMIITHLFKYSCQMCSFFCYNKAQAHGHYRWHKNVIYSCPHCNKEFSKASTRLTHIRIKHPSTNICSICGHSFVSEIGLYFHKKRSHSKEEVETSETNIGEETSDNKLYCEDCKIVFLSDEAFVTHLGSSNKHTNINLSVQPPSRSARPRDPKEARKAAGRPSRQPRGPSEILNTGIATATTCEECGEHLPNDVQARKHYRTEHPGAEFLKRYMCDVCGHTTKQYTNLLVHMRTHTNEKPYACPHCDRRFSMPSNRDRHLVVHTGEKRYECEHCHRRFTQSSAVKLHIQTVHLKIPYAPWDKKNRKRRREMEANLVQPEPKLLVETQGEYLSAYISYHE